ncbi:MAG: hypothetical protein OCU22_09295 [Canidatus Methanoxibalbensis ujae]|nr:hypothetical protein [Candidatus Methanoxibalbensis ujae]
MKPASVAEILQRVEEKIGEEIKAFPSHIRRYGVTNIFHRSFSYLFAWDADDRPRKVRVDQDGRLMVAGLTQASESLEYYEGTAGYNWDTGILFPDTTTRVYFFKLDYPYEVYISKDGSTFDYTISIEYDNPLILEIPIRAVKVRRKYGNDAKYKIMVVY